MITYEGIVALTHQRLHNFQVALSRKIRSGKAVNDVDKQILFLAGRAADLMTRPPSIGADPDARPLASGLSRFAALGAAGFNITRYAAYFAPCQRWLADTMRRGNPDPDREMVLARSTDFLLRFWNSVQGQIPADHPEDLDKMRAYVLGHACAIAGDVVSAPFFNALEMQPGTPALRKLSIDEIANTLDLLAAQKLFRHSDARNRTWSEWFPAANEIPSQFYDAYKTALEGAYGAGARRTGSHAFEQSRSHEEPPLRADLIRDGYASFRSVLEHNYAWSMGDWALATVWIFIPPLICLPVAAALPQGKRLFIDSTLGGSDKEKAWFQLLTLPLAASALFPIVYAIYLMAHSYLGAAPDAILGLVVSIVNLIAAVFYFSTLGADVSAAVRWLLFFIVPVAGLLVHTIYVFARGTTDPQRRLLALGSLLPVVTAIVFVLAYAIFLRFAAQGLQQDGAPANPKAAFQDLIAPRSDDFISPTGSNFIYVRVHNRGDFPVPVDVRLFWAKPNVAADAAEAQAPPFDNTKWSGVAPLTSANNVVIPPHDWDLAKLQWDSPQTTVRADNPHASILLMALIKSSDNQDPIPVRTRVSGLAEFFDFFRILPDSENAAMRAIGYHAAL